MLTGERVACVLIPDFPMEVCLRAESSLRSQPVALVENDLNATPITAVNQKASGAGLSPDVTVAQAGTLCPSLAVKVRDMTREIEESNQIFKKLQRLSPFVEETSSGRFFLDATGLTLLYKSEGAFAEQMIAAVSPLGYPVKVGLARNKFVATLAAEISQAAAYTIVLSGCEQEFLHDLPMTHLPLSSETLATLHDLGLKTIGQLAAFPANEMIVRFGPEGAALARLARGDDTAFFSPELPEKELSDEIHLTFPIHTIATIVTHAEQLLSPLLDNLRKLSRGCCCITITLTLENHTQQEAPVKLDYLTLSVPTFLRQLRLALEKLKLSSGVTGIKVTMPDAGKLLSEQLALSPASGTDSHSQSHLEQIPNSDLIHVPWLCDAFLPEQKFFLAPLSHRDKDRRSCAEKSVRSATSYAMCDISGLRLFQTPGEIEVITEDNRPLQIKTVCGQQPIRRYRGPWELSGEWWDAGFDRLYYEIQTADRLLYLLFFDRLCSRWFLQGIFD